MAAKLHASERDLLSAAQQLVHALEHLDSMEAWQESTPQDELTLSQAINQTEARIKLYRVWECDGDSDGSSKGVFE